MLALMASRNVGETSSLVRNGQECDQYPRISSKRFLTDPTYSGRSSIGHRSVFAALRSAQLLLPLLGQLVF